MANNAPKRTSSPKLYPPPSPSINLPYTYAHHSPSPPQDIPRPFLDAMAVRTAVFITEQHCSPDNEVDPDDNRAWFWIVYASTGEEAARAPVGVLRLIPPPHPPLHGEGKARQVEEPYVVLGRLATLAGYRGRGIARALVGAAVEWARGNGHLFTAGKEDDGEEWKGLVLVHAQKGGAAERFWKSFGFARDEGMGVWIEEGIEHVGMWMRV